MRDDESYLFRKRPDQTNYGPLRRFACASRRNCFAALVALVAMLERAGLMGCGGPGSRTWKKLWAVGVAAGDAKYVVCNGDESEPGTFKDRELMEHAPHLIVAGAAIAALAVGANEVYIYMRREYPEAIAAMCEELTRAEALGACGPSVFGTGASVRIEVVESPGGDLCGAGSAQLEVLEGRRGEPRIRPPEPEASGLHGMPTLVNNVETLAWIALICLHGVPWYRGLGVNGASGRRLLSISGHVRRPGVYEVPLGTPLGDVVHGYAQGLQPGRRLKAIAPAGLSGGFLPAALPVEDLPPDHRRHLPEPFLSRRLPLGATYLDVLDLELDHQVYRALDIALGAGLIVFDDRANMLEQALRASEFFRDESCGKCSPCRLGTQKVAEFAARIRAARCDTATLRQYSNLAETLHGALEQASICGLGMVAARPLVTTLRWFSEDLAPHLRPPVAVSSA